MPINKKLNNRAQWQQVLDENNRRVEVDIDEVERVIELARKTPGLAEYEEHLRAMAIFFASSVRKAKRNKNWPALNSLILRWELYRDLVMHRFSGVTPVELRAADKIVANVFDRFIMNIPQKDMPYARSCRPLVFGGRGGPSAYSAVSRGWQRPFSIINLPHSAFDHAWQWVALIHETGHDLYASAENLDQEMGDALAEAMRKAVEDGRLNVPDVHLDLSQKYNIEHEINYTGKEFLAAVWRAWANESQADVVAYLNCGPAVLAALQQIIQFTSRHPWLIKEEDSQTSDEAEEHPVPYIRNILGIEVLRLLDDGSLSDQADELEERFDALADKVTEIVFTLPVAQALGGRDVPRPLGVEVISIPVDVMVESAKIAAKLLVEHNYEALGGKSYEELGTFTAKDQEIVEMLVEPLYRGEPDFQNAAGGAKVEPRHALAATVYAFEKVFSLKDFAYKLDKADGINKTFMHFI